MVVLERYKSSTGVIKANLCFLLQWKRIWKKYLVILRTASVNCSNGPPVLNMKDLQEFPANPFLQYVLTRSFWKATALLFIKLIRGYKTSNPCKMKFGNIYLFPKLDATSKINPCKIFSWNSWREPNIWHHPQQTVQQSANKIIMS